MGNLCPNLGLSPAAEAKRDIHQQIQKRITKLTYMIRAEGTQKQAYNRELCDLVQRVRMHGSKPSDDDLRKAVSLEKNIRRCASNIQEFLERLEGTRDLEAEFKRSHDNIDEHEMNVRIVTRARQLGVNLDEYEQTADAKRSLHEDLVTMNDHLSEARAEVTTNTRVDEDEVRDTVARLFVNGASQQEQEMRGVATEPYQDSVWTDTALAQPREHKSAPLDHWVTNNDFEAKYRNVYADRLGLATGTGPSQNRHDTRASAKANIPQNPYLRSLLQNAANSTTSYDTDMSDEEHLDSHYEKQTLLAPLN